MSIHPMTLPVSIPLALFGPQIVYIKVQLIALIHMTLGLPRSSINVVN